MRKKTFVKNWLALMLAVISLTCTSRMNIAAAETETTVKGVDVSISVEPREKPYELGEKVPVTVTLKNTNAYQITLGDLKLTSDDCRIMATGTIPEILTAGEEATVRAEALLATYEATKTVQIDGQDIDVHILAAKNTIPAGSAFMVTANVDADKHKKNIDNPENYEAAAIFNLSLEKDSQAQQFKNGGIAEVRIKIPAGWDAHELQMAFITEGEDEQFVELVENGYLVFRTNHFSPYAMLDPVDNKVGAAEVQKPATSDSSVKTGDLALATMVTFGGTAILALVTAIAFRKKIYRKTLAIMFALSLTLPMISTSTADAEAETGTVTAEFAFNDLGRLQQNSDGTVVRTSVQKTASITATFEVLGAAGGGDVDASVDDTPQGPTVTPTPTPTPLATYQNADFELTTRIIEYSTGFAFADFGVEGSFEVLKDLAPVLSIAVTGSPGTLATWTVDTSTLDADAATDLNYKKYSISDLDATSRTACYGPWTLTIEDGNGNQIYTGEFDDYVLA